MPGIKGIVRIKDANPRVRRNWDILANDIGQSLAGSMVVDGDGLLASSPSGATYAIVTKTANYTVTATDETILVNCNGANRTITLPSAVAVGAGKRVAIKKIDASAFTVTVDADASQEIDGELTQVLTAEGDCMEIESDGSSWWIK